MRKTFKYGDIFLVDFEPSVGHEFKKKRPAIIIQSNETIETTNLITVIALTSNTKGKQSDDILVKKDSKNKLYLDSIVKVQAIHAFDKSRFAKKIGIAGEDTMGEISLYLRKHFGL